LLAYIKAFSLLIAIISSFIFPIQEFLDAGSGNEAPERQNLIENKSDVDINSSSFVEARTNQILPVVYDIQTVSEIHSNHRYFRRVSNSLNEVTSGNQFKPLTITGNSPLTNLEDSLELFENNEAGQIQVQNLSAGNLNGFNDAPTNKIAETPLSQGVLSSEADTASILPPVPVIVIQYDLDSNYNARNTWQGVNDVDLLARSMLAEENEKLFDPDRFIDFVGAGWVMVNRTRNNDGLFPYASGDLFKALTPFQQFALGGYIDVGGEVLPGNVAYVANPEAYPRWFGGIPRQAYWKAYEIAQGILDGTIADPTFGALYFADAYRDESNQLVYFADGRTRFWYGCTPCYTIPQLERMEKPPWSSPSSQFGGFNNWSGMQDESQTHSNLSGTPH
jgi:hypothetical protein